jgi:hypothetical protein
MSLAAINSVKKVLSSPTCELKPLARFVLVLLAEHAGKDGTCWPSRRTLAELTGTSQPSIKRALRELESANFIRRLARHNESGAQTTSLIEILIAGDHGRSRGGSVKTPRGITGDPGAGSVKTPRGITGDPGAGSKPGPPYKEEPSLEPTIEPSVEPRDRSEPAGYANLKSAFNGSTEAMLADVQRFMGPLADRQNAINWLTGTLTRYGEERTVEAWTIVTAAAGKGRAVANPLAFWAKTAGGITPKPKKPDRSNMVFKPSRFGPGRWVPKEAVQ